MYWKYIQKPRIEWLEIKKPTETVKKKRENQKLTQKKIRTTQFYKRTKIESANINRKAGRKKLIPNIIPNP